MAYKQVKQVDNWGAHYVTVWYDGPDDHYLVVARTSTEAVITFEHENAPVKLREWLYREIFKKAASDYPDLRLTRRGERLYAPLADLQEVNNVVHRVSRLVRVSDGAGAWMQEVKDAQEKADLERSHAFRAALEADMRRRKNRRFNRGSSKS